MNEVISINISTPLEQAIPLHRSLAQKIRDVALRVLKLVLSAVIEIGAFFAAAVLYPILQTRFDPKRCVETDDPNKDIPIILVHGYLHNSSGWLMQRHWLNKAGYKNVFTVNLGSIPIGKSIDTYYTAILEAKVNEVMAMSDIKQVRLIAHSMGGLVSSHYALQKKPESVEVVDIITLASPLQGTKMAHIGLGKCAEQMQTGNEFNVTLSKEINYSSIRFNHFASDTDLIVSKKSGFNGNEEGSHLHEYDGGHLSILFSRKVNQQIQRILENKNI